MSEDPLEAMARAAREGSEGAFQQRVERERRLQTAARRRRRICRWGTLVSGGLGLAGLFSGGYWESSALVVLASLCMLLAIIFGTALFFMGGIVPSTLYHRMPQRYKDLADD